MQPNQIWLAIEPDLQMVRLAACAVQGILGELGCDPDQRPYIELCVVEAMTNIVKHAHCRPQQDRIELQLTVRGDDLEIEITDAGRAMPHGALERARTPRDVWDVELREGGYGLGLIVDLMRDVRYRRANDLNTLTMTTPLHRRLG